MWKETNTYSAREAAELYGRVSLEDEDNVEGGAEDGKEEVVLEDRADYV